MPCKGRNPSLRAHENDCIDFTGNKVETQKADTFVFLC